jgi:hypothetical protein
VGKVIKKKVKGDKVYIYTRDELSGIEWEVEVSKEEFETCVKMKKNAGFKDPVLEAMIDYALFDQCVMPFFMKIQKSFLERE